MIQRKGSLLSVDNGIIVHGCNAQGVMGSGIAKLIRASYPGAFHVYQNAHIASGLTVGQNIYYDASADLTIVNAITQEFYGRSSKVYVDYDALRKCFTEINDLRNGREVHFPLIGCGLANGDWSVVSKIINETLDDSNINVLWTL